HRAALERYMATGTRHTAWSGVELPGLRRDGTEVPLEVSFGEFATREGRYFTGVLRDISERKRAADQLRRSQEERLRAVEELRRRIATDLHDDVGSSLSQIAILSEVVRTAVDENDTTTSDRLSLIATGARALVDAMSDIVWSISPDADHVGNLTMKMRRFVSDYLQASDIAFAFSAPDIEPDAHIDTGVRREVYLIFKEAVTNLVRHSGCTRATVSFARSESGLVLVVEDNGKGFDVDERRAGHGVSSMHKRALAIGGRLDVRSGPGGTRLALE